jgi:hypothetical protein
MGEDGDDRDPFDRLDDAVGDREGDPFEELAADAEGAAGENDGTPPGDDPADAGVEEVSEPRTGPATAAPGDHPADADAFSEAKPDLAEVDVGDVDEDEVWTALSAARARGSVAEVRDRTYAEVSKHRYCEGCEHFTAPPRAACTNEGTEILAFVDMETVRVVDCPIVAERRRLERQG